MSSLFINTSSITFFTLITIMGLFTGKTLGFGFGAPASIQICKEMLPNHGAAPQTTPSPYNISLSSVNTVRSQKLKIHLASPDKEYFKGFLAIVKKSGDDSKAYGTFNSLVDPQTKAINCFDEKHSAVTHNSPDQKSSVDLEWIAPSDADYQDLELVYKCIRCLI
jgi:hypothetical protein